MKHKIRLWLLEKLDGVGKETLEAERVIASAQQRILDGVQEEEEKRIEKLVCDWRCGAGQLKSVKEPEFALMAMEDTVKRNLCRELESGWIKVDRKRLPDGSAWIRASIRVVKE